MREERDAPPLVSRSSYFGWELRIPNQSGPDPRARKGKPCTDSICKFLAGEAKIASEKVSALEPIGATARCSSLPAAASQAGILNNSVVDQGVATAAFRLFQRADQARSSRLMKSG